MTKQEKISEKNLLARILSFRRRDKSELPYARRNMWRENSGRAAAKLSFLLIPMIGRTVYARSYKLFAASQDHERNWQIVATASWVTFALNI